MNAFSSCVRGCIWHAPIRTDLFAMAAPTAAGHSLLRYAPCQGRLAHQIRRTPRRERPFVDQ